MGIKPGKEKVTTDLSCSTPGRLGSHTPNLGGPTPYSHML